MQLLSFGANYASKVMVKLQIPHQKPIQLLQLLFLTLRVSNCEKINFLFLEFFHENFRFRSANSFFAGSPCGLETNYYFPPFGNILV